MRRFAAALPLVIALAIPGAASAHANLVGTSPEQGATATRAPGAFVLRFDEPVEGAFGAVHVFDERGARVDDGRLSRPRGDASQLAVGLRPGLRRGRYTATYRVVSGDGHPISGGLVFGVGAGSLAAGAAGAVPAASSAPAGTQSAYGATRAVGYGALAVGVGGLLFLLLCWLPALRDVTGPEARWRAAADAVAARWRLTWLAAVAAGAISSVAGLVFQGATAAGTSFWAALDPAVVNDVLDTRAGRGWFARLVAWLALAFVVEVAARRRHAVPRVRYAALGADGVAVAGPSSGAVGAMAAAATALVATPALAGHAAVQSPVALLLGLDIAHIAAMCAWLGGLVGVVALLPAAMGRLEAPERARLLAACATRFSTVALAAVVVLALTGVAQAFVHLHRLGALTGSAYGRDVAVKALLLGGLIALGARNRLRTVPRLHRAGSEVRAGRTLQATVRAEIALLAAVLSVTGALVGSAPPASQPAGGPVERELTVGDIDVRLTVGPARTGANHVDLELFRASDGLRAGHVHELSVEATPPGGGARPLPITLKPAGAGRYVARAAPLVGAGDWKLRVAISAYGSDHASATAAIRIR